MQKELVFILRELVAILEGNATYKYSKGNDIERLLRCYDILYTELTSNALIFEFLINEVGILDNTLDISENSLAIFINDLEFLKTNRYFENTIELQFMLFRTFKFYMYLVAICLKLGNSYLGVTIKTSADEINLTATSAILARTSVNAITQIHLNSYNAKNGASMYSLTTCVNKLLNSDMKSIIR